jgi:hypothetical protein
MLPIYLARLFQSQLSQERRIGTFRIQYLEVVDLAINEILGKLGYIM